MSKYTDVVTAVLQRPCRILTASDWPEYESERPGVKWELIEYEDKRRVWVPNYELTTPLIKDHSTVKIEVPKQ